jgi:hypothetical protein
MTEQKEETLHQKQSKNKPELLDSIEELLEGNIKQTVLNFVEYCKTNKMSIRWGTTNKWYIYLKGKHIASISTRFKGMHNGNIGTKVAVNENSSIISLLYLDAESPEFESFIKKNLSETIWKNIKHCEGCLTTCAPGRDKIIVGKPFKNMCLGGTWYINPDTESLDCIIKLMELRKNGITSGIFYR